MKRRNFLFGTIGSTLLNLPRHDTSAIAQSQDCSPVLVRQSATESVFAVPVPPNQWARTTKVSSILGSTTVSDPSRAPKFEGFPALQERIGGNIRCSPYSLPQQMNFTLVAQLPVSADLVYFLPGQTPRAGLTYFGGTKVAGFSPSGSQWAQYDFVAPTDILNKSGVVYMLVPRSTSFSVSAQSLTVDFGLNNPLLYQHGMRADCTILAPIYGKAGCITYNTGNLAGDTISYSNKDGAKRVVDRIQDAHAFMGGNPIFDFVGHSQGGVFLSLAVAQLVRMGKLIPSSVAFIDSPLSGSPVAVAASNVWKLGRFFDNNPKPDRAYMDLGDIPYTHNLVADALKTILGQPLRFGGFEYRPDYWLYGANIDRDNNRRISELENAGSGRKIEVSQLVFDINMDFNRPVLLVDVLVNGRIVKLPRGFDVTVAERMNSSVVPKWSYGGLLHSYQPTKQLVVVFGNHTTVISNAAGFYLGDLEAAWVERRKPVAFATESSLRQSAASVVPEEVTAQTATFVTNFADGSFRLPTQVPAGFGINGGMMVQVKANPGEVISVSDGSGQVWTTVSECELENDLRFSYLVLPAGNPYKVTGGEVFYPVMCGVVEPLVDWEKQSVKVFVSAEEEIVSARYEQPRTTGRGELVVDGRITPGMVEWQLGGRGRVRPNLADKGVVSIEFKHDGISFLYRRNLYAEVSL